MTPHREVVFVTGASGFVGRRVVKRLAGENCSVRILVRQSAPPGLDPTVEVVVGDLTKPETYAPGLEGATAVVHGALTDNRSNDVSLTAALFDLAAERGVRKFIHLSSIVIYGGPAEGVITEDTAPLASPDAYSRIKLEIEQELRKRTLIPEVCLLRLGCVYGQGGGWWTDGLLRLMQRGKLIVVEGDGVANLIHVDDVAAVVAALLGRANGPLTVYNVTDGMPLAWGQYFAELEKVLGRKGTVSMSAKEAIEYGRKWLRPPVARRVMRKLNPAGFIHPLDENAVRGYLSRAVYSNRKLAEELGFRPRYELAEGIRQPSD